MRSWANQNVTRMGISMNKAMDIRHLSKHIQQKNSYILGPDGGLLHAVLVVCPAAFHPFHRDHTLCGKLHASMNKCGEHSC